MEEFSSAEVAWCTDGTRFSKKKESATCQSSFEEGSFSGGLVSVGASVVRLSLVGRWWETLTTVSL